ncbi:MAG: methylglyoxal synthase [Hyphomicrobiales bacterium]|nr:methylglyoxal synthase [Hyphomicrobiales bacterium]
MAKTLALVAHDRMKDALADWAAENEAGLTPHMLFCTGTTGKVVGERCPTLRITRLASGPLGGDQQIGALIVERRIDGVIFFIDPLSPMPHDVDIKALLRLAVVYDVPIALSRSTADLFVAAGLLAG